jgi:ABC-2 type transport system ATP-binding protein/lipopolysaccharide transport system ATP-binding protein
VSLIMPHTTDHDAEPAIVVSDVSKRFRLYRDKPTSLKQRLTSMRGAVFDEFWALRDVSFSVPKGSTFGLIGHNGSGKSTLLRLMAGIHRPTNGSVTTEGRISALLELGAGFHPELSGRENIYLNGAILGLTRREIDVKVDQIIEFSGLGDFIDSPVKIYSSGMYVRLGFAVSVHVNPDILIIDEVIAVGDEDFQRQCFDHLYTLRERGVTLVIVTHSLSLVQTMCDRAAWFDHGRLQVVGPAGDVVHRYLDKVNLDEAERIESKSHASSDATADVVEDPQAGTLRPIRIDRVEFIDKNGAPTSVAFTKEPLTVRVHWTCVRPLEAPLFSFAVENADNVYVANPGMQPTHMPGEIYVGTGVADYVLDELPLGPGEYTFTFAAHDTNGTTILDKKERFAKLRVQPGKLVVFGVVDMLGEWRPLAKGLEEAG